MADDDLSTHWEETEGQTAKETAATTAQHFWADTEGAHVSETGDHDKSGFHQLMTSVKNAFMHGTTELMTISENLIELGKNSTSAVIKMVGGKLSVSYGPASAPGKSSAIIGSPDTIVINSQSGIYQLHVKDISSADAASVTSAVPGITLMGNVMVRDSDDLTEALVDVSVSSMPSDNVLNGCGGSITLYSGGTDSSGVTTPPQIEMHAFTKGVAYADNAKVSFHRFLTAIQPVVLYNGYANGANLNYDTAPGAGVQGTVPLSETAANFHELRIIYKTDDNAWDARPVVFPNGKNVDLGPNHPAGSGQAADVYLKSATYAISGTSMTRTAYINMGVHNGSTAVVAGDVITVVRVEGRR